MKIGLKNRPVLRKLDDGLILCRSIAQDAAALADFNAMLHSDQGPEKPDERVGAWTRDLLARPHPTFHPEDFTLVVAADCGKIVSSMNLISQTWSYEGIPFGVGRPELVGTLPEYRNRGLVRLQFNEVHAWSASRGELVQGITGIPYYYRQFGYEMGLDLGGGRVGYEPNLPAIPKGEREPVSFRRAAVEDIPFLMTVAGHAARRFLIASTFDERMWRYVLTGQNKKNVNRREFRIIERAGTKEPVGYIAHPWFDWGNGLVINEYELKPGVSWLEVTPSVARYLWKTGGRMMARVKKPRTVFAFWLGTEHPAYDVLRDALPRLRQPYAWYVRVADLPSFLSHVAPVLERRLAESLAVGYSGELKLSFYRSGLQLTFEKGHLTGIEGWQPDAGNRGMAAFPDLTFLRLLFGQSSIDELKSTFADCWWDNDTTRLLLTILFPKKPSSFFGIA
ncbi:MAG: GNAT family N-acetyltransferase [Chloroflexota bacterium]